MTYWAKKWLKFNFVIHPLELEEILNQMTYYELPETRVAIDYEIDINTKTIVEDYKIFYDKVISGELSETSYTHHYFIKSIIDNSDFVRFEEVEVTENNELKKFKVLERLSPTINFSAFALMVDYKDRLSVAYMDPTNKSNLGIEISFPKAFYSYISKRTKETEKLSTFQLYSELIRLIKQKTRKAKAERNGVISKPNFWISESVIEEINNNISLKSNGIRLF